MQSTAFSFRGNRFVTLGSRNKNAGSTRIKVATLTLLVLLFLAGFAALVHAETPVFTLKWGSRGAGNGQFEQPYAVAVDGSGTVYVADSGNNRIQKFSSTGEYQTQWGSYGSGDGQFYSPCGVAVDSSGNVYVVDTYNNRVQKFSSTGAYLTQFGALGFGVGSLYYPYGIAIDGSGNVYVADSMNNRVHKYSSSGVYQNTFGTQGSGEGQLTYPRGLTIDALGNVYVADSENHRVQKLSSTGVYQTQLGGTQGSGNGSFSYPWGVAIDGSGNVYVLDTQNFRVQEFSSTGTYLTQFGGKGDGDGQFNLAYGFAVDSSGNVYVADTLNHRIQKFAAPTSPPKGPCIIATATYGGPLASEVVFMRSVRDDLIGSSPTGNVLVNAWNAFYYSWSPPVANAIADSGGLKTLSSALLSPLLGSMYIVAGVYNNVAWLSPDLAAVVSFIVAATLSISIYILLPAIAIRYGVKFAKNTWKRRNNRALLA